MLRDLTEIRNQLLPCPPQAAAWLSVTFLAVIVLIFVIRMVIYLRRRKRLREDREMLTAHDHLTASTASSTKPI